MKSPSQRTDLAMALAILALWVFAVMFRFWDAWSTDMSAIYLAGYFVAAGEPGLIFGDVADRFAEHAPAEWTELLHARGFTERIAVHYVYPPIWAFLVAPLAGATEPTTFFNITRAIMTLCFAGTIIFAWRFMRPAGISLTIFSLIAITISEATVPFVLSIDLNQPHLLVGLLIVIAFERYLAGKDITAGALLGIAAAIKITPVILCLMFLTDRRWRAAAAAVAVSGGLAMVSLMLAGIEPHLTFLARIHQIDAVLHLHGLNLTFETMVHDFFLPITPCDYCITVRDGLDTPAITMLSKLLLIASTVLTLWLTRLMEFADRTRLRVLLLSITTIYFSPLAWMHYYAMPILLFPGLTGLYPIRAVVIAGIPFWAGFSRWLMEGWLDHALAVDNYNTFFPQHTALVSFAALAGLMFFSKMRNANSHSEPSALPAA